MVEKQKKKCFKRHAHFLAQIQLYSMEFDALPLYNSIAKKSRLTKY